MAVERPAVVPLSFAQSRLWFLDQLQGPSPVYNMAVALRLGGRLDADALGAALADVVGRHESLRTLFAAPEGIPQQLVVPAERADFGWQVVDASGWSAARLGEAIGAAARHTFDLATEIPLRATTFPRRRGRTRAGGRGAPYRRRRLVDDPAGGVIWGWRMPAGVRGGPPAGRRCRCSMWITRCGSARSWVIWPISDSPIAAQLGYWEQALAGMPERLELPTDRPYPPVADYRGASVAVDWPAELQQRVREVAARAQRDQLHGDAGRPGGAAVARSAPAPMWRWGSRSPGARDPALDELVGFFVNTLVLRVDLAGDPTVAELLAQVRARGLAAYEHQDVPFEVLVERLNPTRSLTHHPLVQVMLAWQNFPGQDNDPAAGLALGDVQVTPLPVDTHTARMDLTFSLAERWTEAGEPAGISGTVEFRTDVFDADSIETLIERLQRVVVAMTADPTRRLSSMDLLDAGEHARLDEVR